MKSMKKRHVILFILVAFLCLTYLTKGATYAAFESFITGIVSNKTAEIHLSINNVDIIDTDDVLDGSMLLQNVTWTSTHTRTGKLSPGSSGTITLELDPAGSEVAILYEFRFVDKSVNSAKLLDISNVTSDDTSFVRTDVDTYSGIIPLSSIQNGDTVEVSFDFVFDATVDIEAITEDNGNMADFFEVQFKALQYRGETLVPYVEPVEPEPEPEPEP